VNHQSRFVDLAISWPDGKTEALEVETEFSPRAIENIQKNIEAGFQIVSVLTPNNKVRQAIMENLPDDIKAQHLNKVQFLSISFFD